MTTITEEVIDPTPPTELGRIVMAMRQHARSHGLNPSEIASMVDTVLKRRLWTKDGVSLRSALFDPELGAGLPERALFDLLGADKKYKGLLSRLTKALDKDEPLQGHGGDRSEQVRVPNLKQASANDASYNRRRLDRDRPDLYEQVISGELKTNTAARQAGIKRPRTSIYLDSPEDAIRALLKPGRYTREQLLSALK